MVITRRLNNIVVKHIFRADISFSLFSPGRTVNMYVFGRGRTCKTVFPVPVEPANMYFGARNNGSRPLARSNGKNPNPPGPV